MKILKSFAFAGLALTGLAFFSPKADAGVAFSVSVGSGYRHHHGSSFGFAYSDPCYPRPVYYRPYCYRPYYYSYPAYYTERVVYVQPAQQVVVEQPTVVSSTTTSYTSAPESSFYRLGHDWAKDLRDDVISRDQLVSYLRSHVVRASTADYNEFRRGFIAAYGSNGEAAFDKAYQQARGE